MRAHDTHSGGRDVLGKMNRETLAPPPPTRFRVKKLPLFSLCVIATAAIACNKLPGSSAAPEIKTEDQKTLYTLGTLIGSNVTSLHLTAAELDVVRVGFADAASGKPPQFPLETYGPKVN